MQISTKTSSTTSGYIIALIATAIWSTTAIFIGYLTTRFEIPPLVLAFWRDLFVATTLFAVIGIVARPLLHLNRQHFKFFLLYGFLLAVFNSLWTVSVALNGAALSTVLAYSSPAFTALTGRLLWQEKLDKLKLGAIWLSILGCVLVSSAYNLASWQANPLGIIIGLLSGVAFAGYSIMGKLASERNVNPWTTTLYTFAVGAFFLLFLQRPSTIMWLSRPLSRTPVDWQEAAVGWGILLLLSIGPTIGGYGLYTVSLTRLPAVTANLISTLEPIMTTTMAFFLLGEQLTAIEMAGGSLTLFGVVLLRMSERANGHRNRDR
jgi:drug/metabolite transporter (DMT)-like permease